MPSGVQVQVLSRAPLDFLENGGFMKKKIWLVIGGIVAVAMISLIIGLNTAPSDQTIIADSIIAPSGETGNISEKIVGNPDEATVVIYEYADYACVHCADWNQKVNELIGQYGDKLAVVFRSYDLNLTKNSAVVARAATAAQIQGYFKEYKDILFANQAEWYYAEGGELNDLLAEYFETVSKGAGDLEKFKDDISSDAVKKRLKFEQSMGKKVGLRGTPLFRINGEDISLSDLVGTIEKLVSGE